MVEYRHNYAATSKWLRSDAGLQRALRQAAADIASTAEAIAPVETGAYVGSIEVESGDMNDRQSLIVAADDPAAAPLEFGNARTGGRGHNILSRAAEIAGFDVNPGGD